MIMILWSFEEQKSFNTKLSLCADGKRQTAQQQ